MKKIDNITFKDFREKVFDVVGNTIEHKSDKPILVKFHADWWGPCKIFGQVLEEVYEEYEDKVTFYEVDIEKERELASMFQVRALPTSLFISSGNKPEVRPGGMNKEQLKYYLEGLISKK